MACFQGPLLETPVSAFGTEMVQSHINHTTYYIFIILFPSLLQQTVRGEGIATRVGRRSFVPPPASKYVLAESKERNVSQSQSGSTKEKGLAVLNMPLPPAGSRPVGGRAASFEAEPPLGRLPLIPKQTGQKQLSQPQGRSKGQGDANRERRRKSADVNFTDSGSDSDGVDEPVKLKDQHSGIEDESRRASSKLSVVGTGQGKGAKPVATSSTQNQQIKAIPVRVFSVDFL